MTYFGGGGSTGPANTVAGSDTQVQFNNAGVFGADAGMTYVAATDVLTLANAANSAYNIVVNNSSAGASASKGIAFYEGATQQGRISSYSSGAAAGLGGALQIASAINNDIVFVTNNNIAANLTPLGKSGVGVAWMIGPGFSSDTSYTSFYWNQAQSVPTSSIGLGTASRAMVFHEAGDGVFDFAHAQQTNPTVFIHSAAQSTTQWVGLTHDGTDGVISTGAGALSIQSASGVKLVRTLTTVGTTGNQVINKMSGTVNIAAGGTTVTVTNSIVDTSSIIYAVIRTADTTARIANVVPGSGSFVINIVACAAEVSIGFMVTN